MTRAAVTGRKNSAPARSAKGKATRTPAPTIRVIEASNRSRRQTLLPASSAAGTSDARGRIERVRRGASVSVSLPPPESTAREARRRSPRPRRGFGASVSSSGGFLMGATMPDARAAEKAELRRDRDLPAGTGRQTRKMVPLARLERALLAELDFEFERVYQFRHRGTRRPSRDRDPDPQPAAGDRSDVAEVRRPGHGRRRSARHPRSRPRGAALLPRSPRPRARRQDRRPRPA